MESINSYNDAISSANLLRNANFSTLQEQSDRFIDDEKDVRSKIEAATLPFEVPVLEHTLGNLGKKALVKAGLRNEEDEDGIVKSLGKKGLKAILKKIKGDDGDDDDDTKTETPETETPKSEIPKNQDAIDEMQSQHDVADEIIGKQQEIVDAAKQGVGYDASDGRIAQGQIDAQEQFKTDNPIPEPEGASAEDSDAVKGLKQAQKDAEDLRDATGKELDTAKQAATDAESNVADKEQAVQDAQDEVDGNARRAANEGANDTTDEAAERSISDAKSKVSLNDAQDDLEDAKSGLTDANKTVDETSEMFGEHSAAADTAKGAVDEATDEAAATGEKSVAKSLAEKLAAKAGEAEVEGGGPEDVFGDIAAAGLAIGSLFASIFGKKIKKPDPTAALPALELHVSQGFGLAGN